jgi:hypothetical protein
MARGPNEVEQAVSRTLRDSLEKLQRTTEELNQAVNDIVSACASTRPTNALPPMLRAQTAAASLAASLQVLSRFVTEALQPAQHSPAEQEALVLVTEEPSPSATPEPTRTIPEPMMVSPLTETVEELEASNIEGGSALATEEAPPVVRGLPDVDSALQESGEDLPSAAEGFDISVLPSVEQELHRRANRVAKVSMQDIKMLRPNDVRLGKEHKDLCVRLRDDIERAHREYDRRFQTILGHPVDYFYDWMVEILCDGDPGALGEYPYPSPVLRR